MTKTSTAGNRSENVNMRFDPRLKYLAGIQARNERRTLSSLFETAVEAYLHSSGVTTGDKKESVLSLVDDLWSLKQSERFVKLAETLPHLLTFEEEHLWEIIQERDLAASERLEETFADLQKEAIIRANEVPVVSVGRGFPFRGGKLDTTIPNSLATPDTTESSSEGGE